MVGRFAEAFLATQTCSQASTTANLVQISPGRIRRTHCVRPRKFSSSYNPVQRWSAAAAWIAHNEDGTQKEPAKMVDFGKNIIGKFRLF
jgi:hypothetical protein